MFFPHLPRLEAFAFPGMMCYKVLNLRLTGTARKLQGLEIDVTLDAHAAISYHHRGQKSANFSFSGLLCGNAGALYSYFS